MKRKITQKLAMLNPEKNYEEIMYLLQCYEYPWDYERALEFALFRTYAVPSISALLYKTGEFVSRPRKGYDDTELILYEITENGFDNERGRAALRRINCQSAFIKLPVVSVQKFPAVFVILLLLKYLLPYLTGETDADSGKFWTLFYTLTVVYGVNVRSRPAWSRGVKHDSDLNHLLYTVALRVGAWIET